MFCNDELFEIFSWLSARDLFKFSAVSKSPNEFMSESFFVRKQCKNIQRVPDSDFFIQPDRMQYHSSYQLEKHSILLTRDTTNTMPRESLDFLTQQGQIIASSNGLLCLRNVQADRKPLCLFNPVTKNYLEIPYPFDCERGFNNFETSYLVVMDCTTDEEEGSLRYFLMVFEVPPEFDSNIYSSMIYSPELNSWRDGGEVDLGQRRMIFEYSVKENETVYMISDNSNYLAKSSPSYWPYIVVYDISSSSSEFLSLPKRARKGLLEDSTVVRIFKWGDDDFERSICLVKLRNRVFTVWVLSDKEARRWTCILRMRVKALTRKTNGDEKVAGFNVINGGVLLFATEDKVYSYDLKNGNFGEGKEVCAHECGDMVQLRSCSSTLRSCGSAATTLTPCSSSLQTHPKKRRHPSINKISRYYWMIIFAVILPLFFNLFGGCLFE